eukprot:UN04724
MRKDYALQLEKIINENLSSVISGINPGLNYYPGWSDEYSLEEVMQDARQRDLKSGFNR